MAFIDVMIFGNPDKAAFEKMTAELTKIYGEVLGIAPDFSQSIPAGESSKKHTVSTGMKGVSP